MNEFAFFCIFSRKRLVKVDIRQRLSLYIANMNKFCVDERFIIKVQFIGVRDI